MRKIIYRGAEQIARIFTNSKNTYVFEESNGFSVVASTWADYYEIISYDSTHKNFVDAKDPLAQTDMRRKSQFEYQVPKEVYEDQIKRDIESKAKALYTKNVQAYKNSIYDKIASGIIDAIPETIDADAIAYADKLALPKEEELTPTTEELTPTGDETPADEGETSPSDSTEEEVISEETTETPKEEVVLEEVISEEIIKTVSTKK